MKRYGTFLALLAVLAVLAAPGVILADGCRTRAIYSTYYAPAVSYGYSYYYAAPVYKEVQVVKAVKAYVSPDYYSSVSDYYRDKLLVDAFAGKTQELLRDREELQSLRQELQSLRRQIGGTPPEQQPQQPPPQGNGNNGNNGHNSPPPRMPPANGGNGGTSGVPEKLNAVVQASCVRCHGATFVTAGGGIDLRDLNAVPWEVRLQAYEQVNTGAMPKGGKAIADADVLLFHDWYKAGRQAVRK